MAKYRETPCKFYVAHGNCKKGRKAIHKTYCQHCDKYCPRAKVRHINKKKAYNEKRGSRELPFFMNYQVFTGFTFTYL